MTSKARLLCELHPDWDYRSAWGCPDCMAEARTALTEAESARLRAEEALAEAERLLRGFRSHYIDPDADDRTPEFEAIVDAFLAWLRKRA